MLRLFVSIVAEPFMIIQPQMIFGSKLIPILDMGTCSVMIVFVRSVVSWGYRASGNCKPCK